MKIHRCRYIMHEQVAIDHIAPTPPTFMHPMVSVVRANGDVEFWNMTLSPIHAPQHPTTEQLKQPWKRDFLLSPVAWECGERWSGQGGKVAECFAWSHQLDLDHDSAQWTSKLKAFIGTRDGYVLQLEYPSMKIVDSIDTYSGGGGAVACMLVLPDDKKTLVVGGEDGVIRIYSIEDKLVLSKLLEKSKAPIVCIAWSKNDSVLLAGCGDGFVRCWDMERGRILQSINFNLSKPKNKSKDVVAVWSIVTLRFFFPR